MDNSASKPSRTGPLQGIPITGRVVLAAIAPAKCAAIPAAAMIAPKPFARALIANPEVLILDDSLSAVDAETEEAILNNLKDTREGKTNIITAHRMSAVAHADLIVVMESGTITEMGTHQELMASKGWYHDTFKAQSLRSELESNLDEMVERGDIDGRE